ncbi:DUF423 domain-containing protein [Deinococcus yavapaiensis]|uniref:Uncharacterized membrane protein YgdD (TMEM256/DUF423 family) n=1 Tax=Deinococcus yavapaiensis KR-236 TaxID=694435 RepID=A0A318SKL6_9DEIO|nr:DUF423 domain-containing protein [Deinococcus yavapaiensis]PYE54899.1 uncharacterized membrane protein YgdD (TMEM256/DUF423 family) [Deinococcus yavapaiensis KR-236]
MTTSFHKTPLNRSTVYGAALGGLGVALGAFGAHALKDQLSPNALAIFETGTKYQMYHALALLALGAQPAQKRAPNFLLAGTLIFSGSLYALALSGVKPLGAITPIGGVVQLVGWGLVVADALSGRNSTKQEHPA